MIDSKQIVISSMFEHLSQITPIDETLSEYAASSVAVRLASSSYNEQIPWTMTPRIRPLTGVGD